MQQMAPFFASLVFVVALSGAALAEEPIDIVREIYEEHPAEAYPPGGLDRWTPDMQALWLKLAEEEQQRMDGTLDFMGEGLTFDFVIGGQDGEYSSVKIKTVAQIEYEANVMAVVGKGADAPYVLHYGFQRGETEGWRIAEVWIDNDPAWRLSELIKETR